MKKRFPSIVFLSLGSNLGDRLFNIAQAIRRMSDHNIRTRKFSSVYETSSWGFQSDSDFLNAVIMAETYKTEIELLDVIKSVERSLGRIRLSSEAGYQSRTIDIDVLLYDDRILNTPELVIPHPLMHLRLFVLKPLSEITKDKELPGFTKSALELLAECNDNMKPEYFCSASTFESLTGDIETFDE